MSAASRRFPGSARAGTSLALSFVVLAALLTLVGAGPATGAGIDRPHAKPKAKAPPDARRLAPGAARRGSAAKPRVLRPSRRALRRAATKRQAAYRLSYTGVPTKVTNPAVYGTPRVGGTVSLYGGTWNNVEYVWIDIYRYANGVWTVVTGGSVPNGGSMSYTFGTEWTGTQFGFYAWGYNPTYGWGSPAWSGNYVVQTSAAPPQSTSPPYASGTFQVGGTATLHVGAWTNAQQYYIDVWRWDGSTWTYVSGQNLGSATQMSLTFGPEWAEKDLGFYAYAYNATGGWSTGMWSGTYRVTDSQVTAPPATDNVDTPAVVRNEGSWGFWLSNDFNAGVAHRFQFQSAQSTPLVGDWDGDGIDSPGVNVSGYRWILSNGYDGEVDHDFIYGLEGDRPLVGDWNGDGLDTIAIHRGNCFYWKNSLSGGSADNVTCFGNQGDTPVVGDWNGDGIDTQGVYRNGEWWLNNDFSGTVHGFVRYGGTSGDRPVPGDFDGDGDDTPGIHRGNQFHLSNDLSGTTQYSPVYGNPGDIGAVGDWNPDPMDSWEDEAVTEGSQYSFAAISNDAPPAVVRYAPQVWIASNEQYHPASARQWFMRYSSLRYARYEQVPITIVGRGQIDSIRLGEQGRSPRPYYIEGSSGSRVYAYELTRPYEDRGDRATALHTGFFLDLKDDKRGGVKPKLGETAKVPVYYHYKPGKFITYWFFYPYSDGWATNGDHEGDWERIVVRLDSSNVAREIALYRHTCHKKWEWAAYPDFLGTHPVVYSSFGSHASYEKQGGQDATCGAPVLNDSTSAGTEWRTWEWLADVQRQPWYGFGGAWGEKETSELNTGPVGPSRWKSPAPAGWE